MEAELYDMLEKTIVRRKENVEKKQALTHEEMAVETEDEEVQAALKVIMMMSSRSIIP